jgi:hypothetical protein
MILQICASQIDEYSFTVSNTVSQETYDDAVVDWATFTNVTLKFSKVNEETTNFLSVDISDRFEYMFLTSEQDGLLTINFSDFGEETFNEFEYWPDWLYTVTVEYVYDGDEYSTSVTVGFLKIIKNIVYQQMMKSNWKKELSCSCNCEPYNTTLRKWNYLMMLEIQSELCLINEYLLTLQALYKITGTDHEFE